MKELSEATKIPQSGIRRMFDLAKNKTDVISFCLGEPDFDTPQYIIDAGKDALDRGSTHYTDNAGKIDFRKAVSEYVEDFDHIKYDPETEICACAGAMEGLYLTMTVLLNPGDEVIVADPCYPNYLAQIEMNHGVPVTVPVYEKDGFNFLEENLEKAITEKTKAILLNSPTNPTGGVADHEILEGIARVAIRHDLFVIQDAVYKQLIYDEQDYENIALLPGMRERTIYIDSFSKSHAMTGWRIGYICGPADVIGVMPKLQENNISCVASFVQDAAVVALQNKEVGKENVQTMKKEYQKRRDVFCEGINAIEKLSVKVPKGAFYLFVNIEKTGLSSQEFCEKLLETKNVLCSPGSAFGKMGDQFVRFSYATSMENILIGIDRIKEFVNEL